MEFAGDPTKMSKILGSFNGANLGAVSNTGVMQAAQNEANTILNNFKAQDAVSQMAYKADAAELSRDHRAELAGIQRGAARTDAITSGIGSLASAGISGSGFSMFGGGGSDLSGVNVNSSAFSGARDEANSFFGSHL